MQRLNARMAGFMEQSEHIAVVISCGPAEAGMVLRTIQGADEASASDLYWYFPHTFTDARSWVEHAVYAFSLEHDAIRAAQKREGMAVWPPVPTNIGALRGTPVGVMRNLMAFARSLLPSATGGLVGWGLFPMEIENAPGWATFIAELVRHEHPYPWCHHIRMFVRDAAPEAAVSLATREAKRIDHCSVEFSSAMIERMLREDAAAEDLPQGDRVQAVVILAGIDQSHKRYEEALAKYRLVARYAEKANQPALAAVAFNGMGETYEKMGDTDKAERHFGAALEASSDGGVPATPVMLNALLNCGNLAFTQERWPDAEKYYQGAEQLAGLQSAPETRIQCMEKRGVAIYMQDRPSEALALWDAALTSARAGKFHRLERSILGEQRDHYIQVKDDAAVARTESRMAEAESRIPPEPAHAHDHSHGHDHAKGAAA